jgi:hypothetical protein
VNVTVSLQSPVTSRLLTSNGKVSEALLLIDEPNSGLPGPVPGFGPNEPFTPCPDPNSSGNNSNGCAGASSPNPTYVLTQTGTNGGQYQTGVTSATTSVGQGYAAPNVYQGIVSGSQVTFYGVPVIPPAGNAARVFRITNLRVRAIGIPVVESARPIQAVITASDASVLPLANSVVVAGFEQASLRTAASPPAPFARCNSETLAQSAVLAFGERFMSGFKTRVDPSAPGQINGQGNALVQDVSGAIYNSESGLTLAGVYGDSGPGTGTAGLADFGTRFSAVFNNIPTGVSVFVSQFGVVLDQSGVAIGEIAGGPSWAQAVVSETTADGSGTIPAATPYNLLAPGGNGNIHVIDVTPKSGTTATATWESMANAATALDTYNFAVFISYTARSPGIGTATAGLRYGPAGNGITNVPDFLDTSSPRKVISIGVCR